MLEIILIVKKICKEKRNSSNCCVYHYITIENIFQTMLL